MVGWGFGGFFRPALLPTVCGGALGSGWDSLPPASQSPS